MHTSWSGIRVLTTGPPEKSLLICKFYRHWFNNTFKSLVGNRWLELTHARDRSGGRLAVSAHSHSAGGTNKNQSSYSPNPHSRYYIKGFLNRMKFLDLCKHIIFQRMTGYVLDVPICTNPLSHSQLGVTNWNLKTISFIHRFTHQTLIRHFQVQDTMDLPLLKTSVNWFHPSL